MTHHKIFINQRAVMLLFFIMAVSIAAVPCLGEEQIISFETDMETFEANLGSMMNLMDTQYTIIEDPGIPGSYQIKLPQNVYAKVLIKNGLIGDVLVMQPIGCEQEYLWQYAGMMAVCVGNMQAIDWIKMFSKSIQTQLRTNEPDYCYYAAGNTMMIFETSMEQGILYALIGREERWRDTGEQTATEAGE